MRFRRAFIAIVILTIFTAGLSSAQAQSPAVTNGLSWLNSVQTADGNWSAVDTSEYYSTATSLDAVYELAPTSTAYTLGLQWLNGEIVSPTDYLSRRIIALNRAGLDASSEIENLIYYRNPDKGWGGEIGYFNNILDTTLALQALRATVYDDNSYYSLLGESLDYLKGNQNSDGGWGFFNGDTSNTYVTALVLKILSSYSSKFNVQSSIQNTASYLLLRQNDDHGFGSSPSTVYETALTIEALLVSGADVTTQALDAVSYITANQHENGS